MKVVLVPRFLRDHRYELVAVLVGFIIMVLEIVGARMVAPYFGTSIYVWTAVIGVILGALSLGYWYGGQLADLSANDRKLSRTIVLAALVLLITLYFKDALLIFVSGMGMDLRLGALIAALLLFAPVNFLMGLVSPYLVKLKLTSLTTAGSSVGGLYAAGTLGSILGTFAAGYWLISWLGNRALGLWLVVGLVLASLVVSRRGDWWIRAGLALVAVWLLAGGGQSGSQSGRVVFEADSAYSRYQVVDEVGVKPRRLLVTDNESAQSGIYLDDPSLPAFIYIDRFLEASRAGKAPQKVLLIGGGAFTLPALLVDAHPEVEVDVVEIDPYLSELAQEYFGYQPNDRIRVFNEDGRTFINAAKGSYDLIYIDAFTATTPPFQLTTTEAVERFKRRLTPDGAVVVNMISSLSGADARFGQAELATYRRNFAFVAAGAGYANNPLNRQNLLLVAGAADGRAGDIAAQMRLSKTILPGGSILTDDFAPVEQMTAL